jgi:uncharacterized surface protein with fasciclin (FAS1) repeats
MKQTLINRWMRGLLTFVSAITILTACQKSMTETTEPANDNAFANQEAAKAQSEAETILNDKTTVQLNSNEGARGNQNIAQIAINNPHIFSSLVAAVVKTGLAGALTNEEANLTVFAPTNRAFAELPAPFNNANNINGITDAAQIDFLRNVLLYHVLGTEVKANQIQRGRSSATTLKAQTINNDNTLYFSKTFGLIRINGSTTVIYPNVNASNGVIHVIDNVLLFPTQNIAAIVIGNPNFSTLVAALVKTNLAGVFTGTGDFTVFAPTNAAFAQLPAPFNSAANINAITSQAQIDALANILKYHVVGSRYFAWDLGILDRITTLAAAPSNQVTTVLGFDRGHVKGNANPRFSNIRPADILATNGVIQVIDKVLLP